MKLRWVEYEESELIYPGESGVAKVVKKRKLQYKDETEEWKDVPILKTEGWS